MATASFRYAHGRGVARASRGPDRGAAPEPARRAGVLAGVAGVALSDGRFERRQVKPFMLAPERLRRSVAAFEGPREPERRS